jgi:hypothetical protein
MFYKALCEEVLRESKKQKQARQACRGLSAFLPFSRKVDPTSELREALHKQSNETQTPEHKYRCDLGQCASQPSHPARVTLSCRKGAR